MPKTLPFALGGQTLETNNSSQALRRHEATAREAFDPFPFLASYAASPGLFPILGDYDLDPAFDVDCLDFSTSQPLEEESASATSSKSLLQ